MWRPDEAGPEETFVGRRRELAWIYERARDALEQNRPRVVVLGGIPGIGKSALVQAVLRSLRKERRDLRVLDALAAAEETKVPFATVTQLLRADSSGLLQALWRTLETRPTDIDPVFVGSRLLRLLDRADPTVVVVDDAHLADRWSALALRFALRRLGREPLFGLVAGRFPSGQPLELATAEPDVWGRLGAAARVSSLTLTGLEPSDLAELAHVVTGRRLGPRELDALVEETDGHPLLARALLGAGRAPDEPVPLALSDAGNDPELSAIRQTLGITLHDTDDTVRRLAGYVAELARSRHTPRTLPFVFSVAEQLGLRREALEPALAAGVRIGLLRQEVREDGVQIRPGHALYRSVASELLGPEGRLRLHQTAAALTEGDAQLIHRTFAAAALDGTLAAELAARARRAFDAGDFAEAARWFERAVSVAPAGPGRQACILLLGEALLSAGEAAAARELEATLTALPGTPWAEYVLGYLALVTARPAEARRRLLEALTRRPTASTLLPDDFDAAGDRHPPGPPPAVDSHSAWRRTADPADQNAFAEPPDLEARIHTQLALLSLVDLDTDEMIAHSAAAIAGEPSERVASFAWFVHTLAWALAGEAEHGLALLEAAPASLERKSATGIVRLWIGDAAGAARTLGDVLEQARRGTPLRVTQVLGFHAEALYRLGRLEGSALAAELAVEHAEAAGLAWDLPMLHALACYPYAALGREEPLGRHANATREWATLVATRTAALFAAGVEVLVARDPASCLEAADHFERLAELREPGLHTLGPARAVALVQLGRLDDAEEDLERWRARLGDRPRPHVRALLDLAAGELAAARGDRPTAEAAFRAALARADAAGLRYEVARGHVRAGRSLAALGARLAAAAELDQAIELASSLGAAPLAAEARQLLEAVRLRHGEAAPDPTAATFPLLTPGEQAVARLAAQRLTNREIAEHLYLSVKTVEFHLTRVYAKLGVRSRRELQRFVDGRGRPSTHDREQTKAATRPRGVTPPTSSRPARA